MIYPPVHKYYCKIICGQIADLLYRIDKGLILLLLYYKWDKENIQRVTGGGGGVDGGLVSAFREVITCTNNIYTYVLIRLHEFVLTTTERRRTSERGLTHTHNIILILCVLISPSLSNTPSMYLSPSSPHVLRPPQTYSIMVSYVCMRALVWFRRPGWRKRMYLCVSMCVSVCACVFVCVCARARAQTSPTTRYVPTTKTCWMLFDLDPNKHRLFRGHQHTYSRTRVYVI